MLPHVNVCLIWGVRKLSLSKIGKTWVKRTFISEPISYRATTAKANCLFDLSWTSILLWFASPVFHLPSSCFLSVHLPTSMPAILLRLMMILAHRSPGPMWPNVYPWFQESHGNTSTVPIPSGPRYSLFWAHRSGFRRFQKHTPSGDHYLQNLSKSHIHL